MLHLETWPRQEAFTNITRWKWVDQECDGRSCSKIDGERGRSQNLDRIGSDRIDKARTGSDGINKTWIGLSPIDKTRTGSEKKSDRHKFPRK